MDPAVGPDLGVLTVKAACKVLAELMAAAVLVWTKALFLTLALALAAQFVSSGEMVEPFLQLIQETYNANIL
jgi:hypothetical protein